MRKKLNYVLLIVKWTEQIEQKRLDEIFMKFSAKYHVTLSLTHSRGESIGVKRERKWWRIDDVIRVVRHQMDQPYWCYKCSVAFEATSGPQPKVVKKFITKVKSQINKIVKKIKNKLKN